jgi:transcriptional regulator
MRLKQTDQRDLFRGALEMMVLRSVQREPMHGYALAQHIKRQSKDLLQVEEGSLYPALQRLLKARLLTAEWEISPTNRRVRTYRITPAGRKHLDQELSSFERMLKGINLVLTPSRT